jgi:hypothetical protein
VVLHLNEQAGNGLVPQPHENSHPFPCVYPFDAGTSIKNPSAIATGGLLINSSETGLFASGQFGPYQNPERGLLPGPVLHLGAFMAALAGWLLFLFLRCSRSTLLKPLPLSHLEHCPFPFPIIRLRKHSFLPNRRALTGH